MKQKLCYLKDNIEFCIIFDRKHKKERNITRFIFAKFVKDLDKKKPTINFVFSMVEKSLNQKSTLEPTKILQTTKIKYIVVTKGIKAKVQLKRITFYFGLLQDQTLLYCDIQSAIYLVNDLVYS